MTLEQVGSRFFFVRPGIGKDDRKVVWPEPEFLVRAITVWGEPGKAIVCSGKRIEASRNKAPLNKRYGQAEVGGELLGSFHQFGLNLDSASVKVKHGGKAGHDPETTAPFAKQPAPVCSSPLAGHVSSGRRGSLFRRQQRTETRTASGDPCPSAPPDGIPRVGQ